MTSTLTATEAREQLYEIVRRDDPFEEKAAAALELGATYLEAENGHLTRIDTETDHWEVLVSTDDEDGEFPPGLELDLGTTYCRRTIVSDGGIALHDAPNQGWADDPAFEAHGLHCYHGSTLVVDDEPFGTVCFVAHDPRQEAFDDDAMMFAELLARLLERELERSRHEAQLTRQSNLATVLNRVLRHNLRNRITVVRGITEQLIEEVDDPAFGHAALESIDELIALSDKARELDRIVATEFERSSLDVVALIEDLAASVTAEHPAASISVESEGPITASILESFDRALEELLENAAQHAGAEPTVVVTVEDHPDVVEIAVADDGPGLADHEVEVLESGAETPLVHGSGLGLWLAHWIVTGHGGSISASVTEAGTKMTISVPRGGEPEATQELTRLSRARDRYRAAFEEAEDGMVIVGDEARIVDANPAAAAIYGLESRSLLGRSLTEFLPEEVDFETEWQAFGAGGAERGTVTIVGADGVERTVEQSAAVDVVPGEHLLVSRDITDRVGREEELRSKTAAMDEAPVGITITDPHQDDNPVVYANGKFREMTGYDEEEITGRNCRFLQGAETDPEAVDTIRRAIEDREPVTQILRNYRSDGTAFWNRLTIAPVTDEDGELANFVGFQEDVTERVETGRSE